MRNILVAMVALLPVSSALAEPSSTQKTDTFTRSRHQLSVRGAAHGNPCALYGPGFVKVEGTGSCIKIGGGIDVGVGGSSRH